jgi:DNA-binding CsgD family transcriptional regulator
MQESCSQLVGDGREQGTITGQQWSSVERVDDMWAQSCLSRSATMSRISSTRSSIVIDLGNVRTRASKEIADTLFISIQTVERHRANMLQKLGPHDRLVLARYAIRAGMYSPRVRVGIVGVVRTWRREVSRLRDPWRRGGFDDRHGSGGTT